MVVVVVLNKGENLMKKIESGFWWMGWWGVWLVIERDVACQQLVGVEVL